MRNQRFHSPQEPQGMTSIVHPTTDGAKFSKAKLNKKVIVIFVSVLACVALVTGTVVATVFGTGGSTGKPPILLQPAAVSGLIEMHVGNPILESGTIKIHKSTATNVQIMQDGFNYMYRGLITLEDYQTMVYFTRINSQNTHQNYLFEGLFYYRGQCLSSSCHEARQNFIDSNYVGRSFQNISEWKVVSIKLSQNESLMSVDEWQKVEFENSQIINQKTIGQYMQIAGNIDSKDVLIGTSTKPLLTDTVESWINQRIPTLIRSIKPKRVRVLHAELQPIATKNSRNWKIVIRLIAIFDRDDYFSHQEASNQFLSSHMSELLQNMPLHCTDAQKTTLVIVINVVVIFEGVTDTTSSESNEDPTNPDPIYYYSMVRTKVIFTPKKIGQVHKQNRLSVQERIQNKLCNIVQLRLAEQGYIYYAMVKISETDPQLTYNLELYYNHKKSKCKNNRCIKFVDTYLKKVELFENFESIGHFSVDTPNFELDMVDVSTEDWKSVESRFEDCRKIALESYIFTAKIVGSESQALHGDERSSIQLKICETIVANKDNSENPIYMWVEPFNAQQGYFPLRIYYDNADSTCSSNVCDKFLQDHFTDLTHRGVTGIAKRFSIVEYDFSKKMQANINEIIDIPNVRSHCAETVAKGIHKVIRATLKTTNTADDLLIRLNNKVCNIIISKSTDKEHPYFGMVVINNEQAKPSSHDILLYYKHPHDNCVNNICDNFIQDHLKSVKFWLDLYTTEGHFEVTLPNFNDMVETLADEWANVLEMQTECNVKASDSGQMLNGIIKNEITDSDDHKWTNEDAEPLSKKICEKTFSVDEADAKPYFVQMGNTLDTEKQQFPAKIFYRDYDTVCVVQGSSEPCKEYLKDNLSQVRFRGSTDTIKTFSIVNGESLDLVQCTINQWMDAKILRDKCQESLHEAIYDLTLFYGHSECDGDEAKICSDLITNMFNKPYDVIEGRDGTMAVQSPSLDKLSKVSLNEWKDVETNICVPSASVPNKRLSLHRKPEGSPLASTGSSKRSSVQLKEVEGELEIEVSSGDTPIDNHAHLQKRICDIMYQVGTPANKPFYIQVIEEVSGSNRKKYKIKVYYVSTECTNPAQCKARLETIINEKPYTVPGLTSKLKIISESFDYENNLVDSAEETNTLIPKLVSRCIKEEIDKYRRYAGLITTTAGSVPSDPSNDHLRIGIDMCKKLIDEGSGASSCIPFSVQFEMNSRNPSEYQVFVYYKSTLCDGFPEPCTSCTSAITNSFTNVQYAVSYFDPSQTGQYTLSLKDGGTDVQYITPEEIVKINEQNMACSNADLVGHKSIEATLDVLFLDGLDALPDDNANRLQNQICYILKSLPTATADLPFHIILNPEKHTSENKYSVRIFYDKSKSTITVQQCQEFLTNHFTQVLYNIAFDRIGKFAISTEATATLDVHEEDWFQLLNDANTCEDVFATLPKKITFDLTIKMSEKEPLPADNGELLQKKVCEIIDEKKNEPGAPLRAHVGMRK